jgi:hypothetical protein
VNIKNMNVIAGLVPAIYAIADNEWITGIFFEKPVMTTKGFMFIRNTVVPEKAGIYRLKIKTPAFTGETNFYDLLY